VPHWEAEIPVVCNREDTYCLSIPKDSEPLSTALLDH
jgi:hypothetical protein